MNFGNGPRLFVLADYSTPSIKGMSDQNNLEARLGYYFRNKSLLELALTHRSFIAESQSAFTNTHFKKPSIDDRTNERLEFLGDRVLGLAIVDLLLRLFPNESEGELAQRFSVLASARTLHTVAKSINLEPNVIVGKGMKVVDAIVSDACEALIGAIYLDADFETAREVVNRHWIALVEAKSPPPKDAKTGLQEWAQERALPLPEYELIDRSGPDHSPEFTIAVTIKGHQSTTGIGSSKRAAEQEAAQTLLDILK